MVRQTTTLFIIHIMIKHITLILLIALSPICGNAQTQNTFSEFYMGLFVHDIIELKDSSYIFISERNHFSENLRGTRMYRINQQGEVIDSISLFLGDFWRINLISYGGYVFLNDSTLITGFRTLEQGEREVLLLKSSIGTSIDTIASKIIEPTFPDSFYAWNQWDHFFPRTMTKLNNGNFMVVGNLFGGHNGFEVAYFVEVDADLNVVNSFYTFDSVFTHQVYSCQQLNDGTFIISGQLFSYGSLFQYTRFSNRAFVARIDSNGSIIWRNIIPRGTSPDPWFPASDRPATFEMTPDSTIGLAYFQHLSCRDSNSANPCSGIPISDVIIGRYRFMSFDLNGNLLLDKPMSKSNLEVWRTINFTTDNIKVVPGKGYVFAGNYIGKAANVGFVYRFDQNGDSIWWREPRPRLSNPFEDFLKFHMAKPTSDGGIIGVGKNHFLLSLATNGRNMSRAFVFKLDSNGCYEPGICPISVLNVEEAFSSVDGIKIYPNPADRILNIELEGIQGECRVVLRNMQGQTIVTQTMDDTYGKNAKTEFDVQRIASGLYIVEVHGRQGLLQTKKVIVQ